MVVLLALLWMPQLGQDEVTWVLGLLRVAPATDFHSLFEKNSCFYEPVTLVAEL